MPGFQTKEQAKIDSNHKFGYICYVTLLLLWALKGLSGISVIDNR
jgi:hypothetical protein